MRKLVRDKIPSIIKQSTHKEPEYELAMSMSLYIPALYRKFEEESQELLNAKTDLELVSEMADVYEVMRALCKAKGLDVDSFEKYAAIKRQTNGGFDSRVILITEDETNE